MSSSNNGDNTPRTAPKKKRGNPASLSPAWKPGQSGNPKGRPKGSRNALGEAFVAAMHEDFQEHGAEVIDKVRTEQPHDYLKVIATIIPKEITHDAADPIAALLESLNQPVFPGDRFEPGDGV